MWNFFKLNNKDTSEISDVVLPSLVSLLLTSKRFHALSWCCFHRWVWIHKRRLGDEKYKRCNFSTPTKHFVLIETKISNKIRMWKLCVFVCVSNYAKWNGTLLKMFKKMSWQEMTKLAQSTPKSELLNMHFCFMLCQI